MMRKAAYSNDDTAEELEVDVLAEATAAVVKINVPQSPNAPARYRIRDRLDNTAKQCESRASVKA